MIDYRLYFQGADIGARLAVARPNGELIDFPALSMIGKTGYHYVEPDEKELIPLPKGATIAALPGRILLGIDKDRGELIELVFNPYQKKKERIWAVGALLPQGFTRTLVPAYASFPGEKTLPLLGYTAVGISHGQLVVAAVQTDAHDLWHPQNYNTRDLAQRIEEKKREKPGNRLLDQLGVCSLNMAVYRPEHFLWEVGRRYPRISPMQCPVCGCISSQPSECCPSPKEVEFYSRISEIAEIGVEHLQNGKSQLSVSAKAVKGNLPCRRI